MKMENFYGINSNTIIKPNKNIVIFGNKMVKEGIWKICYLCSLSFKWENFQFFFISFSIHFYFLSIQFFYNKFQYIMMIAFSFYDNKKEIYLWKFLHFAWALSHALQMSYVQVLCILLQWPQKASFEITFFSKNRKWI